MIPGVGSYKVGLGLPSVSLMAVGTESGNTLWACVGKKDYDHYLVSELMGRRYWAAVLTEIGSPLNAIPWFFKRRQFLIIERVTVMKVLDN